MVTPSTSPMRPRSRPLTEHDLDRMRFDYDETTDMLMVYLNGSPEPAISVVDDNFLSYRVDPWSEDVLGYQIDDFLIGAVHAVPSFQAIADLLGIVPSRPGSIALAATNERYRRAAEAFVAHLQSPGARRARARS